jgi:DNA-binding beta-propeller fold protein YncE
VLDGESDSIITSLQVGRFPSAMIWDSQECLIYVANSFSSSISIIKDEQSIIAESNRKSLFQNQLIPEPNPFSHNSGVILKIPSSEGNTSLKIYNSIGQLVKVLHVRRQEKAGSYISWYGRDDQNRPLPAGVYFCQICKDNQNFTRKIILAR